MMFTKIFNPKVRAGLYAALVLVNAVVVFYHLVDNSQWQLWENTILGIYDIIVGTLAFSKTPGITNKVKETPNE